MPSRRFQDLTPERRGRILGAAAEEFAREGYGAASVNRIIESAGISKGQLYYYFEDKEDLFATVMEQAVTRLMGEAGLTDGRELTAATYWNAFRDLMRRSMEALEEDESYVRLLRSFHQLRESARTSQAARRIVEQMSDLIRGVLSRGQALSVVRTDVPLPLLVEVTFAVDEAASRWRVEQWDAMGPDERLRHAEAHVDLMRDMLDAKHQGWED